MTLPRFAVTQCGYMDEEYQCSRKLWFRHLSVIIVTGARGAHKRHHITESKIHISYSKNHDSSLFFYYFYMSPLSTLAHIIAKGSIFFDQLSFWYKKITKKLSWCVIDWHLSILNVNGHAYSYPLPPLWRWGLNLDLKGIERVIIRLSVPENSAFDTIISEYF